MRTERHLIWLPCTIERQDMSELAQKQARQREAIDWDTLMSFSKRNPPDEAMAKKALTGLSRR